jgi:hypothetical protein
MLNSSLQYPWMTGIEHCSSRSPSDHSLFSEANLAALNAVQPLLLHGACFIPVGTGHGTTMV